MRATITIDTSEGTPEQIHHLIDLVRATCEIEEKEESPGGLGVSIEAHDSDTGKEIR
jgi:hypothetical protein